MTKETSLILEPISIEDFFQNYFEKKLLHISRNTPNYFENIITINDIDAILDSGHLYYPDITLKKKNGEHAIQPWLDEPSVNPTLRIKQGELYNQISKGQTLIINTIQKFIPRLNEHIVALGNKFGVKHSANVYITPSNEQGFNWHYDDHDVFILQIKGNKKWSLVDEAPFLPDSNYKSSSPKIENPENVTDYFLKEGDTLYIPRGVYHKAVTEENSSIHLTLAFYTIKSYHLLDHFIGELRKERLFRSSVLSKNTSQLDQNKILEEIKKFAGSYFSKLDITSAEKIWEQSISQRVAPINKNRLISILEIDNISLDSKVKLNPNIVLDISTSPKFIEIKANGKKLKYPIFMQKSISQLLSPKPIILDELTANIPEKHVLDLAKKFIIEGFITIES
jgi:ribosomal protein L16 Arg81 hydroxylase